MDKYTFYKDCKIINDGVNQYLQIGLDYGSFPKKTTAQINSITPVLGTFVFDIDKNCLKIGNGVVFEEVNTEPQKLYLDWIVEDFLGTSNGNSILFALSTASGGTVSTEIPEQQPNWNDVIPKARLGQSSIRINTNTNARSGMITNANLRLFATARFGFASEQSMLGGQINFATDPVLQCWGLLETVATSNPNNSIYFRCPRVGETAFLKYVVRVAGVETVFSTAIPYDATNRRFVRTFFDWDGVNMNFFATDGVNTSLNTISGFLTTYPTLATINFGFGFYNGRNGTGSATVARNLNVDRVEKYYKSVFSV